MSAKILIERILNNVRYTFSLSKSESRGSNAISLQSITISSQREHALYCRIINLLFPFLPEFGIAQCPDLVREIWYQRMRIKSMLKHSSVIAWSKIDALLSPRLSISRTIDKRFQSASGSLEQWDWSKRNSTSNKNTKNLRAHSEYSIHKKQPAMQQTRFEHHYNCYYNFYFDYDY